MKRAISQEFSFWQLLAFSVPAVAMLVVSSLYTAVDGVFVSRFVGSDGLSAINIVLPLDTLAFGVGIMFGTGTSAIVGRKLGQGEAKAADQDLTLATLAAGVLGAVLSALGLVFLEPLVRLLGASDRLLPYCLEYGRILFASAFFTVIQVMYQALFITAGRGAHCPVAHGGQRRAESCAGLAAHRSAGHGHDRRGAGHGERPGAGRPVPPVLLFKGAGHPAVLPPPVGSGHAGAGHGQRLVGDGVQSGHLGDHAAVQPVHAGAGR